MIRTGIDALRSAQLDFLVSDATYRRGAEARSVPAGYTKYSPRTTSRSGDGATPTERR